MNNLHFSGRIESKVERRQLSKLIKMFQFSCSEMKIRIKTLPRVQNVHQYDFFDPHITLREEVTTTVRMLRRDGYRVRVDLTIQL